MISSEQINEVVQRIVTNYHPEKIILFGSYAEGVTNESSDLDLLIIKDSKLPIYKRSVEIRKYLRGMCIPMDLVVYTKDEIKKWKNVQTAFITQILKKGKILYGQNRTD